MRKKKLITDCNNLTFASTYSRECLTNKTIYDYEDKSIQSDYP